MSPKSLPSPPALPPPETPFHWYLRAVRRSGWKILLTAILALGITAGVSHFWPPVYEATATIEVNPRLPEGIVGAESRQISVLDADQFLATQMRLLQSDGVVRPAARKYGLLKAEGQASENAAAAAEENTAPIVLRKLRVSRPPNTFLLQVSYRAAEGGLAAAVANEIAAEYIRYTYDLRYRSSAEVSGFMRERLAELTGKMAKANARLASLEQELRVADPEQRTAVLSSRLIQLNSEYAAAEADRLRKEAAYNSVRGGSLEAAHASTQGEALKRLTDRLNDAQERLGIARGQFGRNFPEYKKAELEVQDLQSQVEQARDSVAKRVEIEFRQAANREAMLADTVAGLKRTFDSVNARSVEFQELKRRTESDRKMADELEQKINEAALNGGFRNSTVRVADPARPPMRPVSPNLRLNLLLALAVSLCAGLVLAVATDRSETTACDVEASQTSLGIPVLGAMPFLREARCIAPPATPGAGQPISLERLMYDEAIHSLLSTLKLAPHLSRGRAGELRSVVITSALPGEGKTLTACQLAAANAGSGRATLLIDADLRNPCVMAQTGLEAGSGLEEALRNRQSWREARRRLASFPGLDILTVSPGSGDLAWRTGEAVKQILSEAGNEYDLIVIDAPPVVGFSATLDVAAAGDAVLLLAVAGETKYQVLRHAIGSLRQVGVRTPGLVLNRMTAGNSDDAYYAHHLKQFRRYSPEDHGGSRA